MTTYEQNLALSENSELRGRIAELEACKESLELLICKIWAADLDTFGRDAWEERDR